jgi:hypothetical protein
VGDEEKSSAEGNGSTARLIDLEEVRSDTLRLTDKAQKVTTIGHQGNTRFKPYDRGDLEWVVGTNPETIYPTAELGPQQGLFEVLKQLSNAVYRVEILRQWKNHNVFQVNLTVPDMETELHGPNFTQLMRRTISTKSRRCSTRREDARHRRRTLRVRTRESRQMNTWTSRIEAEFGESNDKRTTSPTRKDIPQLVCFSPSNIYSLLLQTMSTVSTHTVIHAAPSPPPPSPSVVSAPENTPEPLSPQLARRSLPIREDKKEDHVMSQCPMRRMQKSCKKCGKAGHRIRKCPKKTPVEVTASTVESGEIRSNQNSNTMTLLERVALLDRQEWYPNSCRRCGVTNPRHNDRGCPRYKDYNRYDRKKEDEVSLGWSDNDVDYDLYWNNGDD